MLERLDGSVLEEESKVGRGEERLGRVALLEDAVGGALAFAEQQQEDLEGLIKILKAAQVKPCPI